MPDPNDVVVVVAARKAWPFYLEAAGYWCQLGRGFRGAQWFAFYADRTIYPKVARVVRNYPSVDPSEAILARCALSPDPHDRHLAKMIRVSREHVWNAATQQAFLLTEPDSPETMTLNGGEGLHHAGSSAWTMGQRYTTIGALTTAHSTQDLTTHDE
jgi:hypothetical protein